MLIQNAIKQGASDIHVEPDRRHVRIRYRIDGVLYEIMTLPKFAHAPLISRLKIMSDMNIAERRIPQDGRIHLRHEKRDFDMRVNVLPTVFGEKCVMRILNQGSVLIGLGRLGFMPEMTAELEQLITKPNGMVLATGPTGSGKTTTLYSILNRINSVNKNILTVEDPVEYQLPGVNQVSVNRKSGLTFPVAMRAFLRQDPDIIMVGEIRDLETAEIAVQASLTGHLVLSTLHTNDSPSTIVRLSDMGVEPFLISAAIIGIIAQRLARRLCDQCKEPIEPPVDTLLRLGMHEEDIHSGTFYRAVGCEECMHRGYKGRLGVFELLTVTEELGELIVRRAPLSEISQSAIAGGMTTLTMDGLTKATSGITNDRRGVACALHPLIGVRLIRKSACDNLTPARMPVFEPESVNTNSARTELVRHEADLLVICDYGQILKPETIGTARLGGINLHASLLPKYRGAHGAWAVYHGETNADERLPAYRWCRCRPAVGRGTGANRQR